MSIFAQGSKTRLTYVVESTYGVTPATPTTIQVPFVSFNVNTTIDQFKDESIRGDRQERTSNTGNTHVAGDFEVQLNHANFDPFFESLLTGAFTTNVLKFGGTQKSFTFEQSSLDIGQHWVYTGVMADKCSINITPTANVTAKFSVMGKAPTLSATSICATPTAVTEAAPFTHLGGTFKEGGTVSALLSALQIDIDNGLSGNFTLGANTAQNMSASMVKVSGTATVMFQDAVIANKFLNGTLTSLDTTLTDGTNTIQFTIPKVKYTGLTRQVKGQGTITLTVPFIGLYDDTASSTVVITRSS